MNISCLVLDMMGHNYYNALYHKLPWWNENFVLLTLLLLLFQTLWTFINLEPELLETHKKWELNKVTRWIKRTFYFLILILMLVLFDGLIFTVK